MIKQKLEAQCLQKKKEEEGTEKKKKKKGIGFNNRFCFSFQ